MTATATPNLNTAFADATDRPPDARFVRPSAPPAESNGGVVASAEGELETRAIEANGEFHATIVRRREVRGVVVDATTVFPDL